MSRKMAVRTVASVLRKYKEEHLPEFVGVPLNDVNQAGNFGNTPLHVACIRGDLDEINALLAGGADVNAKGERQYTPLHEAASAGYVDVVKRLLEAGALVCAEDVEGRTAGYLADLMQRDDVAKEIDAWVKKKLSTH